MPNSQTPHSKKLRQATAAHRRAMILADGGRDLRVLLKREEANMLARLQQWHGRPDDPASATDIIGKLLRGAVKSLPSN